MGVRCNAYELYGELAAILELSAPKKAKTRRIGRVVVKLVAGGRNRRNLPMLKSAV